MRLLADMHISPRTVLHLRGAGHDVVRVNEVLRPTAPDEELIVFAISDDRAILTQDLDFSRLVGTSGQVRPSVISLRLKSSRVDHVNAILGRVLPTLEVAVGAGAIVTVEDDRVRQRSLPVK
jgi:predicted nuclease of predicted toxin-antitoxin system